MAKLRNRRFISLLIALAVFVGSAPMMAAAKPSASSMSSMVMKDGAMPCNDARPMSKHQMPCDDMSNCLGMLGCATSPTFSQSAAAVSLKFHALEPFWGLQSDYNGISVLPALPPPILHA
jgi:hypothetical protein